MESSFALMSGRMTRTSIVVPMTKIIDYISAGDPDLSVMDMDLAVQASITEHLAGKTMANLLSSV